MILLAEDGTAEDLERELGLSFELGPDVFEYLKTKEDPPLPKTFTGLIRRIAESDFEDSDVGSLSIAFGLQSLRVTPKIPTRRSSRITEQVAKDSTENSKRDQPRRSSRLVEQVSKAMSTSRAKNKGNIEGYSPKKRKIRDRESLESHRVSSDDDVPAGPTRESRSLAPGDEYRPPGKALRQPGHVGERRVNKLYLDVMEAFWPADPNMLILIDADRSLYKVDRRMICSSETDGSVKRDGKFYIHVEVKTDSWDDNKLQWQVGIQFQTLISEDENNDREFQAMFQGEDGVYR